MCYQFVTGKVKKKSVNKRKQRTTKDEQIPAAYFFPNTQTQCNQRGTLPSPCHSKPLMSNKTEADLALGVTLSVPLIASDIVLNAADGGKDVKGKAETPGSNTVADQGLAFVMYKN